MIIVTFTTLADVDADSLASLASVEILTSESSVSAIPYHTMDEGVYTAPTCTTDGFTSYTCGVCGHVDISVDEGTALGHTHGEAVIENEVAPTSQSEGSYDVVVYCTVCGDEVSRTSVYIRMIADINFDGYIDMQDVSMLLKHYNEVIELDEDQLAAADVNGDGEVDLTDASLIMRFYNEIITCFPVEEDRSALGSQFP